MANTMVSAGEKPMVQTGQEASKDQIFDSIHCLFDWLETLSEGDSICFSYIPIQKSTGCHNANTLGASLLARVYSFTKNAHYRALSQKSMRYTASRQRADASWFYAENANTNWVDNFHTAYVLDCFKYYAAATGDDEFEDNLKRGYEYWNRTFFLVNGTPKYYDYKTLPLDIQCSSQGIDTLVFFNDRDPENLNFGIESSEVDYRKHAGQ